MMMRTTTKSKTLKGQQHDEFYVPSLNARLIEHESGKTKDKRELVRRLYKAGQSIEEAARKSYGGQLPADDNAPDFDLSGVPTTAYRMRQTFKAYLRKCEEWVEDLLPAKTKKKRVS